MTRPFSAPDGATVAGDVGDLAWELSICAAGYGETKLRDATWDLSLKAHAYENRTIVVAVNRAGDEHGRRHIGRSMIVNPVGSRDHGRGWRG